MADQSFNLDDNVQEFTEFTLLGHKYKFRQFNSDEAKEMSSVDKSQFNTWVSQFITPIDGAPTFETIAGKMLIKHWDNFNKMIYAIMGLDEKDIEEARKLANENKGSESTI
jgi:hypothetical protein